jgi:hypothetical protein
METTRLACSDGFPELFDVINVDYRLLSAAADSEHGWFVS